MDLKQWMSNLDATLKQIPIIFLAIPGTHDSMTFSINPSSAIAPDCESAIKFFLRFGYIPKRIVVGWSITQSLSVEEQLNQGIRYLDLRIAKNDRDNKFYFVHALFGPEVSGILETISQFLSSNEEEVVILDFQHFYNMTVLDHVKFIKMISKIFGRKICSIPYNIYDVTLSWMKKLHYQVIIIYRSDQHRFAPKFWPSYMFPTYWPNQTKISQLIDFLNDSLEDRETDTGLVSQCVLTPDNSFVFRHLCGDLKHSCTIPSHPPILQWISEQHAGEWNSKAGVNVIICNFIELNDSAFCKVVIELNYKLLEDIKLHNKLLLEMDQYRQ